jgi:hypothetical protein
MLSVAMIQLPQGYNAEDQWKKIKEFVSSPKNEEEQEEVS